MVLMDTHVLLWMLFDDEALTQKAVETMRDEKCCVSVVSFWEMAIKLSAGKLKLPKTLGEIARECERMEIDVIDVGIEECLCVQALPFIHRDPFDRMLIAHAMTRDIPLITHDGNIHRYEGLETIW